MGDSGSKQHFHTFEGGTSKLEGYWQSAYNERHMLHKDGSFWRYRAKKDQIQQSYYIQQFGFKQIETEPTFTPSNGDHFKKTLRRLMVIQIISIVVMLGDISGILTPSLFGKYYDFWGFEDRYYILSLDNFFGLSSLFLILYCPEIFFGC